MKNFTLVFLFIFPFAVVSQTVSGKVYDSKSSVKNLSVFNLNQKSYTHTSNNGDFSIEASVNDTLLFSSLFYEPKTLIVKNNHLNTTIVIEVKTKVNRLNEINIVNNSKKFNEEKYTVNLGNQLKNDMKNNPHLYKPAPSTNMDFIAIGKMIFSLFKKSKPEAELIQPINYKTFDSLFSEHSFFSKHLLENDFKIAPQHHPLFFDYCDAQQLDSKLLKPQNEIILLDSLTKYSISFNKLIKESID